MKHYYKLIDIKGYDAYTLFHGINRSRKLSIGTWIKADKKLVRDGSDGTQYLSGFHLLESIQEAYEYLDNFTNTTNKGIAICEAKGLRDKEHSRSNVVLADEIKILAFYDILGKCG